MIQASCNNVLFSEVPDGTRVKAENAKYLDRPIATGMKPSPKAYRQGNSKGIPADAQNGKNTGVSMKEIALSQGKVAKVSDHRFEELNKYRWHAHLCGSDRWYAERKDGKKTVRMHRQIMGDPSNFVVDHIDGDGLNNQDENLRVCTQAENLANRNSSSGNSTGYIGVTYVPRLPKPWVARIVQKHIEIYLGAFSSKEEAAKAYDTAAKELRGKFATLNFP